MMSHLMRLYNPTPTSIASARFELEMGAIPTQLGLDDAQDLGLLGPAVSDTTG